jgi:hypothetical protein
VSRLRAQLARQDKQQAVGQAQLEAVQQQRHQQQQQQLSPQAAAPAAFRLENKSQRYRGARRQAQAAEAAREAAEMEIAARWREDSVGQPWWSEGQREEPPDARAAWQAEKLALGLGSTSDDLDVDSGVGSGPGSDGGFDSDVLDVDASVAASPANVGAAPTGRWMYTALRRWVLGLAAVASGPRELLASGAAVQNAIATASPLLEAARAGDRASCAEVLTAEENRGPGRRDGLGGEGWSRALEEALAQPDAAAGAALAAVLCPAWPERRGVTARDAGGRSSSRRSSSASNERGRRERRAGPRFDVGRWKEKQDARQRAAEAARAEAVAAGEAALAEASLHQGRRRRLGTAAEGELAARLSGWTKRPPPHERPQSAEPNLTTANAVNRSFARLLAEGRPRDGAGSRRPEDESAGDQPTTITALRAAHAAGSGAPASNAAGSAAAEGKPPARGVLEELQDLVAASAARGRAAPVVLEPTVCGRLLKRLRRAETGKHMLRQAQQELRQASESHEAARQWEAKHSEAASRLAALERSQKVLQATEARLRTELKQAVQLGLIRLPCKESCDPVYWVICSRVAQGASE